MNIFQWGRQYCQEERDREPNQNLHEYMVEQFEIVKDQTYPYQMLVDLFDFEKAVPIDEYDPLVVYYETITPPNNIRCCFKTEEAIILFKLKWL